MSTRRKPTRPIIRKPTPQKKKPAKPIYSKQRELDTRQEEVSAQIERLKQEIEDAPRKKAVENEKRKREVMMRAAVIDRPTDARYLHDDDEVEDRSRNRSRPRLLKQEARADRQRFFVLLAAFILIGLAIFGWLRQ